MERNIPDVRDIFGRSTAQQKQQQRPELRSYDCSPRSRRRHDAMDSYENNRLQSYAPLTPSSETPPPRHSNSSGSKKTASSRNRCSEDFAIGSSRKSSESRNNRSSEDFSSGRKTSAEDSSGRNVSGGKDISRNTSSKDGKDRSAKDAHHYSNRTLTERDIRHLERHLSMKKTIRKQISRNLAQAFVDDPDLVFKDSDSPSQKGSNKAERSFTLTRAKVSRSEQNVLDLLKDNEPDSGHCSADNPNSSDDDCNDLKTHHRHPVKQHEGARKQQLIRQCPPPADSVVVARKTPEQPCREDSKFSFWKMFSVKSKGKR